MPANPNRIEKSWPWRPFLQSFPPIWCMESPTYFLRGQAGRSDIIISLLGHEHPHRWAIGGVFLTKTVAIVDFLRPAQSFLYSMIIAHETAAALRRRRERRVIHRKCVPENEPWRGIMSIDDIVYYYRYACIGTGRLPAECNIIYHIINPRNSTPNIVAAATRDDETVYLTLF